ncbi:hypothetical protein GC174_04470 [bacterium]|nr:hypothetical protein [bacterium]
MSQVHKVINLKTPLKVFGFTVKQIILLALGVILGFLLASKLPHDWKVGHLPAGLFAFVGVVGVSCALSFMTEVKPMPWWRNAFLYRLKLVPDVFIPKPEDAPLYPDPTIIEKSVGEEFYIDSDKGG